MKAIIIAAGYATRLYPLTENFPKPLLKVGRVSILERLMTDIDTIPDIDEHIIVSNHKFAPFFEKWKDEQSADGRVKKRITVIDDGTSTNETRLGAVRDLLLAIDRCAVDDDILVAAADNILDFSFQGFVDYFKAVGTSVIMCHKEPSVEKLQRTGVIKVDDDMRVLMMQEKPQVPVSHWAVPPFYVYSKKDLPLIKDSINNGCGADAPGNLAHYLVDNSVIHAWHMPGSRLDIGSMDSYHEACRLLLMHNS